MSEPKKNYMGTVSPM